MNRRFHIALLTPFLLGLLCTTACLEESDDAPFEPVAPEIEVKTTLYTPFDTLLYTMDQVEVEPLDQVSFEITINAEGGFAGYSIYLSVNGAVSDTLIDVGVADLNTGSNLISVQDRRSFEIPSELVNNEATFRFVAFDQEGRSGSTKVTLLVRSPRVRYYQEIALYEPTVDYSGACFFQSGTGKTFTPTAVLESEGLASKIDFGYYKGVTSGATIASPKGFEKVEAFQSQVERWPVLNTTLIRSTTQESLEGVDRFEDIDLVYSQAVDESGSIVGLEVGKVVAFETVKGKRGLIRVLEILPGDPETNESNGYIKLDIVVQERTPRN